MDEDLQGTSSRICTVCAVGAYRMHHELLLWWKCNICGHCTTIPDDRLSKEHRKLKLTNLYARHPIKPY